MTLPVLSQRMQGIPMPPKPPIVYWSDRVMGWWPNLDRRCPSCIGGYLDASPPIGSTPGEVSCINCGREAGAEVQDRPALRHPMMAEEVAPRIGRPPRAMPAAHRNLTAPCPICGAAMSAGHGVQRCGDCEQARRFDAGVQGRLLSLLEAGGEPLHHQELCELLAVSHDSLRQAIKNVRRRGYRIVRSQGGRYSLGAP